MSHRTVMIAAYVFGVSLMVHTLADAFSGAFIHHVFHRVGVDVYLLILTAVALGYLVWATKKLRQHWNPTKKGGA